MLFENSNYEITYEKGKKVRRVLNTKIRIIDFGSATFDEEYHSQIVSTRHYRAPEVILELGWSHPCDVWSIGCILFELYSGSPFFEADTDIEHLAMMQAILGKIPKSMANKTKKSFFENGLLKWNENSEEGWRLRDDCIPLSEYIRHPDNEEDRNLFSLIEAMLEYDPAQRITLSDACRHIFFNDLTPEQKYEKVCY